MKELKDLVGNLRLPKDGMPEALEVAEQLRVIRTCISISEPKLHAHAEVAYYDDLADFANKVRELTGLGLPPNKLTARAYDEEQLLLLALYRGAVLETDAF